MNGYFRLRIYPNATCVMLYPPTNGGEPINPQEMLQYFTIKQIQYDAVALLNGLRNLQEPVEVKLNCNGRYPEAEQFFVRVSQDKMVVTARFYPPSDNGQLLNFSLIERDLHQQKITYGILEKEIKEFLNNREYCKDIVIARGKEPVQGSDARIEYYFNTDIRIKPTLLEDGSVDFFHLNIVNHCHQGDILARLFPAVPGVDGESVYGNVVKPRDVKRMNLRFGKHISIDENKTVLTSEIDGHVMLAGDSVFVSNVFEVENVDNSTGDIDYEGSVQINGNVRTNFVVKAKGNVEIAGVVEGATIEAGGDIIIARGINGMGRGTLKAGGNIVSKFIENTTVTAGGCVTTESIIHSNVSAKTEITLEGRKAFITGGNIKATNKVTLRTLGSPMGAQTTVEVGMDPELKNEYTTLQKEIGELVKNRDQINTVLDTMKQKLQAGVTMKQEQLKYIQSLVAASKQVNEDLDSRYARVEILGDIIDESTHACVIVTGEVYAGTQIVIGDASMTVRETFQHCRFIRDRGEITISSI